MREASYIFSTKKIMAYFRYYHLNFNVTLTNSIVSFNQPDTDHWFLSLCVCVGGGGGGVQKFGQLPRKCMKCAE